MAKGPNPYLLYHLLGEILKQEETPLYLWDNDVEQVLDAVHMWIDNVLNRGAERMFIWNQTTNLPSREVLRDSLSAEFDVTDSLEMDHITAIGSRSSFVDHVFCCRSK